MKKQKLKLKSVEIIVIVLVVCGIIAVSVGYACEHFTIQDQTGAAASYLYIAADDNRSRNNWDKQAFGEEEAEKVFGPKQKSLDSVMENFSNSEGRKPKILPWLFPQQGMGGTVMKPVQDSSLAQLPPYQQTNSTASWRPRFLWQRLGSHGYPHEMVSRPSPWSFGVTEFFNENFGRFTDRKTTRFPEDRKQVKDKKKKNPGSSF